ncbi:MAG TPA: hypothetical protein DD687_09620 [Verrucomicrobiales bacterium]|nr:hypothetical protein [Verrucomicrobiales bacterium]
MVFIALIFDLSLNPFLPLSSGIKQINLWLAFPMMKNFNHRMGEHKRYQCFRSNHRKSKIKRAQ